MLLKVTDSSLFWMFFAEYFGHIVAVATNFLSGNRLKGTSGRPLFHQSLAQVGGTPASTEANG